MPIEIRMPRLMDSMSHGTLAAWRKAPGEIVRAGEVLAEIEADKTTVDLESPGEGTLAKILIPAGTEKVEVGTLLAVLDEGMRAGDSPGNGAAIASPSPRADRDNGHPPAPPAGAVEEPEFEHVPPSVVDREEVAASPLARSMARQAGLDLASLNPGGAEWRILQADVLRALGAVDRPQGHRVTLSAVSPSIPIPELDVPCDTVPHSRLRRVIAERLGESKRTIPHFYLEVHCCVDPILRLRVELQEKDNGGLKLSLNDFVLRAAARAARTVPEVNASWTDAGMRRYRQVNLAVAVATDAGLVAPVLRDADRKGLSELADEVRGLAVRAREGRLRPDDLEGGTLTVSNLGMYGVDAIYAIINPPQAAILGIGAAAPRPVARDGAVVVATMMTCTLSGDHRALDGADAARFLSTFRRLLERPLNMLM